MEYRLSVLFGTPLWSFKADNIAATNEALTKAIQAERQRDPAGVRVSNQLGWQSKPQMEFNEDFKILVNLINKHLMKVGTDYGFGEKSSRLRIASMWANVNSSGGSNLVHSHQSPIADPNPLVLSGCYYVKVPPKSGAFVMYDFFRPLRYIQLPFQQMNMMNSHVLKIDPKEGSLLFFPAWMEHGVEVNESDEERLSIAFNVALLTG